MLDDRETLNITGGMDVYGSDGEKVGSVAGVQGDYVVVSKGFFFPTDYYIPSNAINTADGEGVYLNVTKDNALNQGWDEVPTDTTSTTTRAGDQYATDQELNDRAAADAGLADQTAASQGSSAYPYPGDGRTGDSNLAGDTTDSAPFDHRADAGQTHTDDTDTIRVPLTEEEITAQKHEVDRGAVQVDKVVTEEQQTLDVPVSEERVNVTRRTVDRDLGVDDTAFEEGTIEVPVRGEEVDVQKNARVREELEITKDKVQDTRHVTDTVRREEARVRGADDQVVNETTGKRGKKKAKH